MLFSIVVLNYNGYFYLNNCFKSILSQPGSYEVILADNNSSDESREYTSKHYPEVTIINTGGNVGYSQANNYASIRAKGEYLVFLNNDTMLDYRFIEELTEFVLVNSLPPIVAVMELSYDGDRLVSFSDGLDFLGYGCRPVEGKLRTAPGCCFVVRRDIFNKLGGFDNDMFVFHEETDLCWRAYLQGYEVVQCDQARFYHCTGGLVPPLSIKRRYLSELNNIRAVLKNYSLSYLLVVLPIYLAVNLVEIGYLTGTRQWKAAVKVYARAWYNTVRNLPSIWQAHRRVQRNRVRTDWQFLNKAVLCVGKYQAFRKLGSVRIV